MGTITLLEDCEKTMHAEGKPRIGKITMLEDYKKTMHAGLVIAWGK